MSERWQSWEALDEGKIRCLTCSHRCTIAPGRSGICQVRRNVDGKLFSPVYGRAIAVHVDPIEKKPLHHFLPGSSIYSLGTLGCNLKCDFCQNWDISQVEYARGRKSKGDDIEDSILGQHLSPEQIVAKCIQTNQQSIAFTYNEPSVFIDYAMDTARLAKARGLHTVFVTNGYESAEAVEHLAGLIDAFNVDVKAFTEEFYRNHCKAKLAPVLETVQRAHNAGIWVEVTTLLIPGENDGDAELDQLTKWLASVSTTIPWHISAFHPDFKLTDKEVTPVSTLERAYQIGKRNGLQYIYMGNVRGAGRENTDCPKCGVQLVQRSGMMSTRIVDQNFDVSTGKCKKCQKVIEGVWS